MRTLAAIFGESARRFPDNTAVEDPTRRVKLTYRELNDLSDGIRDRLVDGGVRPGDRVGLYMPKSCESVATLLGILKAGAAYVPVDYTAPPERNAFIFGDCSVAAVVSDRGIDWSTGGRAPATVEPLSYILYTSGSTGQPKGVMHTNSSALAFVDWCSEIFEPDEHDRFSSHASFHFDLSILDLFVPLKHGAAIVLIGEDVGKNPSALAALISESRITMWYSTPSILRLLSESGKLQEYDYSALRVVNFAGEVFPMKHFHAVKSALPDPRYLNLYGPTETNVCTFFEVPADVADDRTEPWPIGYVCSGDRAMAADEAGRPVPVGEPGELLVSGDSVMGGYWNQPERTARAFFVDSTGAKWYRTGDMVVGNPDGCFTFVGRRDRMVKRRGYRIELGEIESALYRHANISEAAVVAIPDEENGVRITAFLCTNDGQRIGLIAMKRYCSETLPLYMIPDTFDYRDQLPKTSTDKVDYQQLLRSA